MYGYMESLVQQVHRMSILRIDNFDSLDRHGIVFCVLLIAVEIMSSFLIGNCLQIEWRHCWKVFVQRVQQNKTKIKMIRAVCRAVSDTKCEQHVINNSRSSVVYFEKSRFRMYIYVLHLSIIGRGEFVSAEIFRTECKNLN